MEPCPARFPCWLAILLVICPIRADAASPGDREVERLVRQLGSGKFAEREQASQKLEAIGEPARSALRTAAASPDPEIQGRADRILLALNTKLQVLCYQGHAGAVFGAAFTPDGRRLVTASTDGSVHLIEADTGKLIHRMAHPSALSVAVSPDGTKAISTGLGDKQSLAALGPQDRHGAEAVHRLPAWGLPGGLLARRQLGSSSGRSTIQTVRWLDLATGREPWRFDGHAGQIHGLALSTDGKTAFSGSHDATVRVLDTANGKERKRLEGHTGFVWALAVSPDGKRLVSGGNDHTIKVWDLETGKEVRQMRALALRVHALVFSPDGRRIASGNFDHRTVSLWDPETGAELHRFEGHTDEVYEVAFSPDGRFLVSTGRDKTVRVWRVPR